MGNPFTASPGQTGPVTPGQAPLPVIDPGLLIAVLEACGWVRAGAPGPGHVAMAPRGMVVVPTDKTDPQYARQMTDALTRLEHEFGLRPSLLEGVTAWPGTLP